MSEQEATEGRTVPSVETAAPLKPNLRQRVKSIAAAVILIAIFATPIAGFIWLRGTIVRETEMNALWHTQTMLIRHLVRTRGDWPASWDDLEEDFQPTNKSHRTDSSSTLHAYVEVDFEVDPQTADVDETDEPPSFIALKSGRLEGETQKANRQLREYIGKSQNRAEK